MEISAGARELHFKAGFIDLHRALIAFDTGSFLSPWLVTFGGSGHAVVSLQDRTNDHQQYGPAETHRALRRARSFSVANGGQRNRVPNGVLSIQPPEGIIPLTGRGVQTSAERLDDVWRRRPGVQPTLGSALLQTETSPTRARWIRGRFPWWFSWSGFAFYGSACGDQFNSPSGMIQTNSTKSRRLLIWTMRVRFLAF